MRVNSGASVSSMALKVGVNANQLHKWIGRSQRAPEAIKAALMPFVSVQACAVVDSRHPAALIAGGRRSFAPGFPMDRCWSCFAGSTASRCSGRLSMRCGTSVDVSLRGGVRGIPTSRGGGLPAIRRLAPLVARRYRHRGDALASRTGVSSGGVNAVLPRRSNPPC